MAASARRARPPSSGELSPEDVDTEVFFLPGAAHTEKDGSFTNTQRLLQWHNKAVEPPGDARSELWFMYHLGRRIRAKLAASEEARDRPVLDLTWDYPRLRSVYGAVLAGAGALRGSCRGGVPRRQARSERDSYYGRPVVKPPVWTWEVPTGREVYAWHPGGVGRSELAKLITSRLLVELTARNWSTVTKLLALADERSP